MILKLLSSLRLSQKHLIVCNGKEICNLHKISFSLNVCDYMPRKLSLRQSTQEDQDPASKWESYVTLPRNSQEDIRSFTNYGSVRVDSENLPTIENSGGGSIGKASKEIPSSASRSNYMNHLVSVESDEFFSPTPLVTRGSSKDDSNTIKENFSFGKYRENKTLVAKVKESEDMNYIDQVFFKDMSDKLSSEKTAKQKMITPNEKARTEHIPISDLNEIDQEYFNSLTQKNHVEPVHSKISKETIETNIHNINDLNYIDKHFFQTQTVENNNFHSNNIDSLPEQNINFDMNISKREKSDDHNQTNSNTRDNMRENEYDVGLSPGKLNTKKSAKIGTNRTLALKYVKEVRKTMEKSQVPCKHPSELIGQHLQDRFLEATSNLQRKKVSETSSDIDEEIPISVHVSNYCPPDLNTYTKQEVKDVILSKILYNDHDLVALWKPYGMPMFLSQQANKSLKKHRFSLECFLPDIAAEVGVDRLYEVHRLDSTTTGVVLYGKTKDMEIKLKNLIRDRKIEKEYVCICNGVPDAITGIVDIPVSEGMVGGRVRMTLRPKYSGNKIITNKNSFSGNTSDAITEYRVLSNKNSASLLSVKTKTGKKHQIRLHLGLGLGCPILGDHKYSHADIMGKPQRVKGDIVQRLRIRKSKSRNLPIFLHARSVKIPSILPEGNLVIRANLPHFFNKVVKRLKVKSHMYGKE